MKSTEHARYIFTIEDFWTAERCEEFIRMSEAMGYEEATVETEKGHKRIEEVRNNQRILRKDEALAQEIWEQVKDAVPSPLGNSIAVGINELFRFYKYDPGQEFKRHRDGSYIRSESEASYFTLMIYLNEDFSGGETTFNTVTIRPKTGTCLLFLHDLEHEGSALISGTKYVLRTDIMYRLAE